MREAAAAGRQHPVSLSQSGNRGSVCRAQRLQQPVRPGQRGGYPAVVVSRRLEPGTGGDDGVRRGYRHAAGIAPADRSTCPLSAACRKSRRGPPGGAEVVPPAHQGQDDWPQGCALVGQLIFEVTLAGDPHITRPRPGSSACWPAPPAASADGREVRRTGAPPEGIADDQQRPPLADDFQRAGQGAGLPGVVIRKSHTPNLPDMVRSADCDSYNRLKFIDRTINSGSGLVH